MGASLSSRLFGAGADAQEHIKAFEMSGSCGDTFMHPNKDFAEWRMECQPIRYGDWELEVLAVPKSAGSLEDFAAPLLEHREEVRRAEGRSEEELDHSLRQANEVERDAILSNGKTPADLLWDFTSFGTLTWDWSDHPDPSSDVMRTPQADEAQGPIITVDLPPATTATDVYVQGQLAAFAQIDHVETEARKGLMIEEDFKALVKADCDKLLSCVHKVGTFGQLALPAGLSRITEVLLYESDGNERVAIFATDSHCFHIHMMTS